MPREKGDPKAKLFDRLIAQGEEPVAAAKQAGVKRPGEYVAKRAARNAKRAARNAKRAAKAAVTVEAVPVGDRDLAKQALRTQVALGQDSLQVRAASELLKHSPESKQGNATARAVVVFHGRDEGGERIGVSGIPVDQVVEAVRLAEDIRAQGRDEALAAFSAEHAIDVGELAQTWLALSVPSVRRSFEHALAAAISIDPTLRTRLQKAREVN